MMRKCVFGILLVAAVGVAVALVPESLATCGTDKLFASGSAQTTCGYGYQQFGASSAVDFGSIIGRYWQPGSRSSANEGTHDDSIWLKQFGPPDQFYFTGGLAPACGCNTGCVSGEMIMLLQTKTTDGLGSVFTIGRVPEAAAALAFDFSCTDGAPTGGPGPIWAALAVPRPRVTASSRAGSIVTLNIAFDSVATSYHENTGNPATPDGTINAYRLLRGDGTADLGRSPGSYPTLVGTATNSGGGTLTGVTIDCSTVAPLQDAILVTQLQFNSEFLGDYVSASTRVKCNSTLAEPHFKLIDKKPPKGSIGTRSPR